MSDYNAPAVFSNNFRKARYAHTCCECKRCINPRDTYEHVSGLWEGEWMSFKTCVSCSKVRDALAAWLDEPIAFTELSDTICDQYSLVYGPTNLANDLCVDLPSVAILSRLA